MGFISSVGGVLIPDDGFLQVWLGVVHQVLEDSP